MLKIEGLSVNYGDARAVSDVAFEVGPREIFAVIGANGAGKSSTGKAIAGLVRGSGLVEFEGRDVSGSRAEARVRAGIVYVPEGRRVFSQQTVGENLRAGAFIRRRSSPWQERLHDVYERVPRLKEREDVKAGLLSGGEQQLLAICRALMAFPRLLIIDEPSLGLSPMAIRNVGDFLTELTAREDLSVILLEQNISFTSRLAERALALSVGEVQGMLDRDTLADPEKARAVFVAAGSAGMGKGRDTPEAARVAEVRRQAEVATLKQEDGAGSA